MIEARCDNCGEHFRSDDLYLLMAAGPICPQCEAEAEAEAMEVYHSEMDRLKVQREERIAWHDDGQPVDWDSPEEPF